MKVVLEYFPDVRKVFKVGNKAEMEMDDYKLSRYACYLIVQNGNPRKKAIALGQTYFAIQTRKQEILEKEYKDITEAEKRLVERDITRKENKIS